MQLHASELFDDKGQIAQHWAHFVVGQRAIKQPAHGLSFTQQSTYIQHSLTIQENVKAGVYITLSHANDSTDIKQLKNIQVTPVYQDAQVDWSVEGEQAFHWSQIFIEWDLLSQVTGESHHNAEHFFKRIIGFDTGATLELMPTTAILTELSALLSQDSKNLALVGKLYSFIFHVIEHIQIRRHISQCEGCQQKLFKSQNLLESRSNLSSKELAQHCELTQSALEIGYPLIIGMTLDEYQIEVAIRKVLHQTSNHTSSSLAQKIRAQTGLDANEIEEACLKRFGVMSHQLGSMQ